MRTKIVIRALFGCTKIILNYINAKSNKNFYPAFEKLDSLESSINEELNKNED